MGNQTIKGLVLIILTELLQRTDGAHNTLKVGIKRHVMSSSCISQHTYLSPIVLILLLPIYEFPSQITKPLNFSFIMSFFLFINSKIKPMRQETVFKWW